VRNVGKLDELAGKGTEIADGSLEDAAFLTKPFFGDAVKILVRLHRHVDWRALLTGGKTQPVVEGLSLSWIFSVITATLSSRFILSPLT